MNRFIHLHSEIFSHISYFLDVCFVFLEQIGKVLCLFCGGFYKLFRGMSIILWEGGAGAQKSGLEGWSPPKSSNIRMHSSFSRESHWLKTMIRILQIWQSLILKFKSKGISLLLLHVLVCSEFLWGVWGLPMSIISASRLPNMVGGLPWGALTWTLWWTGGLIWHMGCSSRADSIHISVHLKRSRCCWSTFRG